MKNQEQHSTLIPESVEMQQLSQSLQDAIHMTTENVPESVKLHIQNNLLEQGLNTMALWQNEAESWKKNTEQQYEQITHRNALTFAEAMQTMSQNHHFTKQHMKQKLRALRANAAETTNLEAPTPPIPATDMRTPDGTTTQSFGSEGDDNMRSTSSYIKPGDLPDPLKFNDEHRNDGALK
ncbi:hypothetical protein ACJ72_08472 [Emergomyces africanus]|uniref:Uncharacterized protein n=1 Tax=Emergomyces africanus TaxID=1955775 RepID=A0A1B7NKE2_9EURO|nr:hypothetical protein ACJ72_08472 [Emergomyces africanus]